MAHRIEQIFLRSAMRVMASNARFRRWFYSLVGIDKVFGVLLVTFGAELTARRPGQI